MKHVMIDLETMGVKPGCPVLSIGAVVFDPSMGTVGDHFYGVSTFLRGKDNPLFVVEVGALAGQQFHLQARYGLVAEEQTWDWWSRQEANARAVLTDPNAVPLPELLDDFRTWLGVDAAVWGNGADFDNPILSVAYHKCGMDQPWKPYNGRCYRTIKNLVPHIKMTKRQGTHHNALDDAISQAVHLNRIVQSTGLRLG